MTHFKNLSNIDVDTASISDAADSIGLLDRWLPSIVARVPGAHAVGPAYTVSYQLLSDDQSGYRNAANYIDDVPAGAFVVSVNSTGVSCTTWGGILAVTAQQKKISGAIISGYARDIHTVNRIGFPLFSEGVSMVSAKNRIQLHATQIQVEIDGVAINPGDLVVADDNGVIVIPQDRVETVLNRAFSVEEVEHDIVCAVRNGVPLKEARTIYGYATPWQRSVN